MAKGAEVVIPAGGRLTAFLNANGIREVDGAPLVDGTVSLLTATESAVRIRRQTGSFVSRRRLYARAPHSSIAAAGTEYAEGYQLPALGRLADQIDREEKA
jgi:allantoin racemase